LFEGPTDRPSGLTCRAHRLRLLHEIVVEVRAMCAGGQRACVRVSVSACMRASVRVCVRARVLE
jgi:hypothetical protein